MLVDQNAHVTSVARRYPQVKFQRVPLTLFWVGDLFALPPQGFLVPLPNAARLKAYT